MYRVISSKVAFLVIALVVLAITGAAFYSRLDYILLGRPGAVLEGSPVPGLDVPAGATDVYIYQAVAAGQQSQQSQEMYMMLGQDKYATAQCGDWSVWFNCAADAQEVFRHFERQLCAVGFRQTFSQDAPASRNQQLMRCYTSRNGLYEIEVVRWNHPKTPPAEDGLARSWAVVSLKQAEGGEPLDHDDFRE